MTKYLFKKLSFLMMGLVIWQCTPLERDNPLDPKNPDSESDRIVLVEAFVNDGTPYSPFALTALDNLVAQNQSQVLFLEYHLVSSTYADDYAIPSANTRYNFYETQNQAVPDVFVNGLNQRIQGATTSTTALARFQRALSLERDAASYFSIEAKASLANNILSLDIKFARLGDENLSDFAVHAVAFEDLGFSGHHNVVRHIWPPENFDNIEAGNIENVDLTASVTNQDNPENWQVIVFIQKRNNKEVLQAAIAEIK